MSSFYGGKEGRTYHIVQRYDAVNLNIDSIPFIEGTTYQKGTKLSYNGNYYVVLANSISSSTAFSDTTQTIPLKGMVQQFAKGGAYTKVNYGQYVIIDTIMNLNHKSDLENGLLYRRGFDYNDAATNHPKPNIQDSKYYDVNHNFLEEVWQADWAAWVQNPGAGAIYVGQIVGPQGDSPEITPVNWNEIKDAAEVKTIIPVSTTRGDDTTVIQTPAGTVYNGDTIKTASLTLKDNDNNITGAKIAFDIPNTIQEPGDIITNPYAEASFTENPASTAHPFWYKWDFTIPGGKRGQDIEEIKVEDSATIGIGQYHLTLDKEINSEKIYYILQDEQYIAVENPSIQDINTYYEADKYFTYSVRDYTESAAGAVTAHLGRWPYRVIDGITLINDTRSIISWEHLTHVNVGDLYRTEEYTQNMYWVCLNTGRIIDSDTAGVDEDGVSYQAAHDTVPVITSSAQAGTIINNLQETSWRAVNIPQTAPAHSLIVSYTAGEDDQFERVLRNVDHLSVDKYGNMYAFYSDNISQSYYLTNVGGMKNGTGDDDRGIILTDDSIKFYFYNGTVYTYPLKQILSIDFKDGTPKTDENGNWIYDEQGKPVFEDGTVEDSNLRIRYKDGTFDIFQVKRIESITYNNGNLNASQNIVVHYKGNQDQTVTIDEQMNEVPINMVTAIGRKGDNILVLYSDPGVRERIPSGKKVIVQSWKDPVTGVTYENLEWYNFGQLGAQYHIQGEYDISDLKGDSSDPNFTTDLSNGFTGDLEGRMGWLVTLTDGQGNKRIYAFDYNDDPDNPSHILYDNTLSHWYEIMEIGAASIDPSLFMIVDSAIADPSDNTKEIPQHQTGPFMDNMFWFVKSSGHDTTY